MSAGFAVIVGFTVRPAERASFLALLRDNARTSVAIEPECRRFDIVEPTDRSGEIWLYEIYADRAAFDAHLKAPHFTGFDAATRDMVIAKTVIAGPFEENAKP